MAFTVQLFGTLEVRVNQVSPAPLASRRTGWLLTLLILRRRAPVEREWLASTLWPDSDTPQALYNLRRALSTLRTALGPEEGWRLSSPTSRTIRLDLGDADCDLCAFDDAVRRGDRESLETAVSLYRGPLLDGCEELWAVGERRDREEKYLNALEKLAESGLPEAAVRALRHVVAAAPARASARQALMTALGELGDYAAAIQVYRDFRLYLHDSQRSTPDAETTALYQALTARGQQATQSALPVQKGMAGPSPPPAYHLPTPLTTLIGREAEVERVTALLTNSRLVTLTGTGGVGKTRLALAVADGLFAQFPDGAWFADLASLAAPEQLSATLVLTLGLREAPGHSQAEVLAEFLRPRRLLLVLDNCEHLLSACAGLARTLLESCPALHVLATSREALGVTGEVRWRVPSLALPGSPGAGLAESTAVKLFVERATQANPSFLLSPQTRDAVAQICLRLDGIPLAIEMAAARTRAMTARQIAERLDNAFRLLSLPGEGQVPRHQTLRTTMDWSWDLLDLSERTLLARLSVFASGFVLEAAEDVCEGDTVEKWSVLDLLTFLSDKSLLIYEHRVDGTGRYRLLETVRQYGRDRLLESGGEAIARRRHADWFLGLAEEADPQMAGPEQASWLERLETEHDNLRAALDWYEQQVDGAEASLRLAGALSRFWYVRGHWSEGRRRLGRVLKTTNRQETAAEEQTMARAEVSAMSATAFTIRATALNGAGRLAYRQSDGAAAQALHEESLAIYRHLGDQGGIARSLNDLGNLAYSQGDYGTAQALYSEGLERMQAASDQQGIATALLNLGAVALGQDDYAKARALYEESLAIQRRRGNSAGIAATLERLGDVVLKQGDGVYAQTLLEESLAIQRQLGNSAGVADALSNLGHVARRQGDRVAAVAYHEAALRELTEQDDRQHPVLILYSLAELAEEDEDLARAEALYAEVWARDCDIGSKAGSALLGLGRVVLRQGDVDRAEALLTRCLAEAQEVGSRSKTVWTLQLLAELTSSRAEKTRAAHLWATVTAMSEVFDLVETTTDPPAACKPDVEAEVLAAVLSEIRGMSWEQAADYARKAITNGSQKAENKSNPESSAVRAKALDSTDSPALNPSDYGAARTLYTESLTLQ